MVVARQASFLRWALPTPSPTGYAISAAGLPYAVAAFSVVACQPQSSTDIMRS